MIEIPQSLARHLWAVFRRCFGKPSAGRPPAVEIHADAEGLRARAGHYEVALEYCLPGPRPVASVCLPLDALAAFAGRGDGVVTLEGTCDGKVLARWHDAGVPQVVEYEPPDGAAQVEFPAMPEGFTANPPALRAALDEAVDTAAAAAMRYAVHRLLLRGQTGEVVATDGKQLLVQGGFSFGWAEDLLVPCVPVFGGKELGPDEPVEVGRTADHVVVRTGRWTLGLRNDGEGRFPNVDAVVPRPEGAGTYVRLAPADALFLAATLPRLPGRGDEDRPITVETDGRVCVRARAAGQTRTTVVVLARSECAGPPVRLCLNRDHLARALQLGLADLYVGKPDAPVLWRDDRRSYVVLPLPKEGALPPAADALRIESAAEDRPLRVYQPERTTPAMSVPTTNGQENGHAAAERAPAAETPDKAGSSIGALIAEAQALRDAARDLSGRACRLLAALQRHRRQSRLVASTLQSLRQLQQIGG